MFQKKRVRLDIFPLEFQNTILTPQTCPPRRYTAASAPEHHGPLNRLPLAGKSECVSYNTHNRNGEQTVNKKESTLDIQRLLCSHLGWAT